MFGRASAGASGAGSVSTHVAPSLLGAVRSAAVVGGRAPAVRLVALARIPVATANAAVTKAVLVSGGQVRGYRSSAVDHAAEASSSTSRNQRQEQRAAMAEEYRDELFLTSPEEGFFRHANAGAKLEYDTDCGWTAASRRTGLITRKLGMMSTWDAWGIETPLTVLEVVDNIVVAHKTVEQHGYNALVVGAVAAKAKHVKKPVRGVFEAAGVPLRRKVMEFRISDDAFVDVGTILSAAHFVPGQLVDVCGTSKGKGFQGPMKRWGFGGLAASHGVSKAHRSHGSTGASQDPGKVWKGKKMAGRMGGKRVTRQNNLVYKVDTEDNLVFIKGCVPGATNSIVRVTDAIKKTHEVPPPFPTYVPRDGEEPGEYVHAGPNPWEGLV